VHPPVNSLIVITIRTEIILESNLLSTHKFFILLSGGNCDFHLTFHVFNVLLSGNWWPDGKVFLVEGGEE